MPVVCIEGSFVLSNARIYTDDRVRITVVALECKAYGKTGAVYAFHSNIY